MQNRRTFLKNSSATVAGAMVAAAITPDETFAADDSNLPLVVVVHGTDIPKMIEAGIAKFGGWDAFFKEGKKVALKPNVAWKSKPEQGGNTHPEIVKTFVLAAEARKVAKISIRCDI